MIFLTLFLPAIIINTFLIVKIINYIKNKQTKSLILDVVYSIIMLIIYYPSILLPMMLLYSGEVPYWIVVMTYGLAILSCISLIFVIMLLHVVYNVLKKKNSELK